MNLIIHAILSIPKTIFLNFRVFKFKDAIRFPVLVSFRCRLKKIYKNCIKINSPISFAMIRIGFGATACVPTFSSTLMITKPGTLIFAGKAIFGEGINLRNSGIIYCGDNFCCNANFRITCGSKIDIGNNVLIGWNSSIRDSNGHKIFQRGGQVPNNKPVFIGDHVWIGAEAHILRGTSIDNDSVVGFGSIVAGQFSQKNVIIAGNPAIIIKENVDWKL